jgi:hypothetical protein
MIASIHYHARGHDLLTLAALCNERMADDRYAFNLTRPLQLAYEGGDYWYLRGTSVLGEVLHHSWVQGRTDARPSFPADLDRYDGIEWTDDANTALDRLLELERRHAAAKEKP